MLRSKFVIFSIEMGESIDPVVDFAASPPGYIVVFDKDPAPDGTYNISRPRRGSVIPTLDGFVIQNFITSFKDYRIEIADEAAFSQATVTYLDSLWDMEDTFFFTDGIQCWTVNFARPDGLSYMHNVAASLFGRNVYDYNMKLVVSNRWSPI